MQPRANFWIEQDGQVVLSSWRVKLLEAIAETGSIGGEEALYAMSLWTFGQFRYDPVMTLVEQNIHSGAESLFIGLSSKVDRYHYLLSRCPSLHSRLGLSESMERPEQQDAEQN